jgi:hypothetical protein
MTEGYLEATWVSWKELSQISTEFSDSFISGLKYSFVGKALRLLPSPLFSQLSSLSPYTFINLQVLALVHKAWWESLSISHSRALCIFTSKVIGTLFCSEMFITSTKLWFRKQKPWLTFSLLNFHHPESGT